jgi:hypothetical protein
MRGCIRDAAPTSSAPMGVWGRKREEDRPRGGPCSVDFAGVNLCRFRCPSTGCGGNTTTPMARQRQEQLIVHVLFVWCHVDVDDDFAPVVVWRVVVVQDDEVIMMSTFFCSVFFIIIRPISGSYLASRATEGPAENRSNCLQLNETEVIPKKIFKEAK